MNRHLIALSLGLALLAGTAPPLLAEAAPAVASAIIERLETEGYDVLETRKSWFGRLVITSARGATLREVVVNRTTGAILSDRLFQTGRRAATAPPGEPKPPAGGAAGPGPNAPTDGKHGTR